MRMRFAWLVLSVAMSISRGAQADLAARQPPAPAPPVPQPPGSPESRKIVLEDVGYGIRAGDAYFNVVVPDPRNPERVFVSMQDGYIYRTEDGGRTWDEATILVEQRQLYQSPAQSLFVGHVRTGHSTPPVVLPSVVDPLQTSVAPYRAAQPPMHALEPIMGDSGHGGPATSDLGIGLSARAPRLSILIQRKGKPVPAINLQRLIVDRGKRESGIFRVLFHPTDTHVVYAGTGFGLYRSQDGGRSWVRIWLGTQKQENLAEFLSWDPADVKHVFLGTGGGLFESNDGGENFRKSNTFPGSPWVSNIVFRDSYIFVATNQALWRSPDRGRSWELPYVTTFPTAANVLWFEIDPFDPDTGYIATMDGLFKSTQIHKGGSATWGRLGGFFFAGQFTLHVHACNKHRGHLYASGRIEVPTLPGYDPNPSMSLLYETWDGGANWVPIFTDRTAGGRVEWFEADPSNNDELWVATGRALFRLRRGVRSPTRRIGDINETIYSILGRDTPSPSEILARALQRLSLDMHSQAEIRDRVKWSALLPRLHLYAWQGNWSSAAPTRDIQFLTGPRYIDNYSSGHLEWAAIVNWDLSPLTFTDEQLASSNLRVSANNRQSLNKVQDTIIRASSEMLRLKVRDALVPPKTLKARVYDRLRLEELQALIEFYTGSPIEGDVWRGGSP